MLRQWLIDVAANEQKPIGTLNYIFCTDAYLLQINRNFLKHHTLTDIITFPIEEPSFVGRKSIRNKSINGEIYISIERVEENAIKFESGFSQELLRVIVHGLLHLCGYKDKNSKDAVLMRKKEDFYITRFTINQ